MKKIVNILVCFCCVTLLAKLPAVSCLYAQTRSDREINAIKIPKKDSTGRIVLPHKILLASVSTVKTPKDSLSITKRLISHTIKHLENGQSAQALYTIHEALSNCPKEEIRTKAIAGESEWKKALSQENMPWTQVLAPKSGSEVSILYQFSGIPFLVIIDKEGKISSKFVRGEEEITKAIDKALEK